MAYNGGYKVIDLKGVTLSSTAVTIAGIYDAIESNNKATMLSGFVFDSVEYDDVFTLFVESSGDFVTTVNGITITVTDDDEVTAEEES